ncbi:MAG: hypothetical protein HY507_00225 [Candidatus Zambryskibacteria bacterium]|nr:hypothetical protein [Candidatus Zambryskibacteria bacterium]
MEGIKLTSPEEESHQEVLRKNRVLLEAEAKRGIDSAAKLIKKTVTPGELENAAWVAKRENPRKDRQSSNI